MNAVIPILTVFLVVAAIVAGTNGTLPNQVSGIFAGALIAILAEPIRRWIFRPVLHLHFGDTDDYIAPSPRQADGKIVDDSIYLRVGVTNSSTAVAKGCRAYITKIEERHSTTGGFYQATFSDSLRLFWACKPTRDEKLAAIDIPKGVRQFVDVLFAASSQPNVFTPCVEFTPLRYSELIGKAGTFRLTVMVAGDELLPAELKLIFTWKGQWNTFTATQET